MTNAVDGVVGEWKGHCGFEDVNEDNWKRVKSRDECSGAEGDNGVAYVNLDNMYLRSHANVEAKCETSTGCTISKGHHGGQRGHVVDGEMRGHWPAELLALDEWSGFVRNHVFSVRGKDGQRTAENIHADRNRTQECRCED